MEIDNSMDIIDSRDVIERIEELEDIETENIEEYETEELLTLRKLASEGNDYSEDWEYGKALIRDTYFKEYAQEFAESCGMISNNLKWPCNHIDWDSAINELQIDYAMIDFDGVDYWIR